MLRFFMHITKTNINSNKVYKKNLILLLFLILISHLFYSYTFKNQYFIQIPKYYYNFDKNEKYFLNSNINKKYNPEFNSPFIDLKILREISKGHFRTDYLNKECYQKVHNQNKSSKIFLKNDEIKINYDNNKQQYILLASKSINDKEIKNYLIFLSKCYLNSYEMKILYKANNSRELINLLFLFNFFIIIIYLIVTDLNKMRRLL